jgi:CheY-like chemotaxis protein/HPt (histidine-containing phosphotransfer) domain-containing protein
MGGDIHVETREGRGSTFTLDIPLRLASPPKQASVSSPGALRPDARILIAEDNEVNQHVLQRMLSMLGYRNITIVNDGEAAVQACCEGAFELVLMDCQMPVLDGQDATRRLRSAGLRLPVLALTASATDRDRDECLAAGMDDYLTKPIELPVLGEKVQKWLKQASSACSEETTADSPGRATFNVGAIKQYFLGDAGFFAQARELFIRTTGNDIEQMRSAVSTGDAEGARRVSHRIKASAATVGAELLSILCKQYETGEVEPSAGAAWVAEAAGAFDAFVQASHFAVGGEQETSVIAIGVDGNSGLPVDGSDASGRDRVNPSRTILVVEDEPDVLATTQTLLEMAGYRVRTASDGARALSILEEDAARIDLVYTDFLMPVVDGLNLCRRLRARSQTRGLPIVLTSAAITTAPGEPGLFNAFLKKPVVFAELQRVIESVLR